MSLALQYALKTTASALIALYCAFFFDLSQPQWAAMTALVVAQPQSGMVLNKGLTRLIGTFIGAIIGILLVMNFAQSPYLLIFLIALILMLVTFFATILRSIWAYTYSMIGITVPIIVIPNIYDVSHIFDAAVARCTEISIGIIVTSIIFSVFWPTKVQKILIQEGVKTLQSGFKTAASFFRNEAVDESFLDSLSTLVSVDNQREIAIFEGKRGKDSADAIVGMSQNLLILIGLSRSIRRDKKGISQKHWHLIEPWITKATFALESNKRAHLRALHSQLVKYRTVETNLDAPVEITLYKLELLLEHSMKAYRFLRKAELDRKIQLEYKIPMHHFRNYSLGLLFGLRPALAFIGISTVWLLFNWSLLEATSALMISSVICSLFGNLEHSDKIALGFLKGLFYCIGAAFFIEILVIPNITGFEMLALSLGIPVFIFSLLIDNPKYSGLAKIFPINFLMLVKPDNHTLQSVEYLLNQSIAMFIGILISLLAFKLIRFNTPYWQGKVMQKAILDDLIKVMNKPLKGITSWFNSRMSVRLILLARHKELMVNHAVDRWKDAVHAMDIGEEIYFMRIRFKAAPQLQFILSSYFRELSRVILLIPNAEHKEALDNITTKYQTIVSDSLSEKEAKTVKLSLGQINRIWYDWCSSENSEEIQNGA